jgi:putative tricarboxylic transport membrane protein
MHEVDRADKPTGPRDMAQTADGLVCCVFCLLGAYICYSSVMDLQAFSSIQVGSGVIPFLVGALMVLSASAVLFQLRMGRLVAETVEMPTRAEGSRALALLVLTVCTVTIIPLLGMILSLGLFILIELLLLERRGLVLSLATAIILPTGLYLLFQVLLGVPLPAGLFS